MFVVKKLLLEFGPEMAGILAAEGCIRGAQAYIAIRTLDSVRASKWMKRSVSELKRTNNDPVTIFNDSIDSVIDAY